MKDTWELVGGVSVTDVGSYDACISLAQQKRGRYHYCDMQTPLGPFIRYVSKSSSLTTSRRPVMTHAQHIDVCAIIEPGRYASKANPAIDASWLGVTIRWGACLPKGCTGADVAKILLPANLGIEVRPT